MIELPSIKKIRLEREEIYAVSWGRGRSRELSGAVENRKSAYIPKDPFLAMAADAYEFPGKGRILF